MRVPGLYGRCPLRRALLALLSPLVLLEITLSMTCLLVVTQESLTAGCGRLSRLFENERRAYEAEIEASFETPEQAKERYVDARCVYVVAAAVVPGASAVGCPGLDAAPVVMRCVCVCVCARPVCLLELVSCKRSVRKNVGKP